MLLLIETIKCKLTLMNYGCANITVKPELTLALESFLSKEFKSTVNYIQL